LRLHRVLAARSTRAELPRAPRSRARLGSVSSALPALLASSHPVRIERLRGRIAGLGAVAPGTLLGTP